MTKAIVQDLPSGGTEWGQSFWRDLLFGCARRALLSKWHSKQRAHEGAESAIYFDIGKIYHAFQEIYHTPGRGKWDARAVEFTSTASGDNDEAARIKAEGMFREYRRRFKPNHLGKVIAVEETIPRTPAQKKAIDAAIGFPDYTCRIDLVTKITAADVPKIRKQRLIRVTPGYWLRDFKTAAYVNGYEIERQARSVQFILYQLAYAAAYPKRKIQGLIVDFATKGKVPEFPAVAIRFPGTRERRIVASMAEQAQDAIAAWGTDPKAAPCNPDRCFDYFRICRYLINGECKRY